MGKVDKDIKIWEPQSKESTVVEGAKLFKLYSIISDIDLLREFRKSYIETLKADGNVFYKIISTHHKWFYYDKGIYDFEKMLKDRYYEFATVPIKPIDEDKYTDEFISGEWFERDSFKAVRINGHNEFYYVISGFDISKYGKNWIVYPTIKVSEEIYNLAKIQFRDFKAVTIDDLSPYKKYFRVENEPNMILDEGRLEDLLISGAISRGEYKDTLLGFDREAKLVKTLM